MDLLFYSYQFVEYYASNINAEYQTFYFKVLYIYENYLIYSIGQTAFLSFENILLLTTYN